MIKKNNSCIFVYVINKYDIKLSKSCNDLSNLSNPCLCVKKPEKKLVSYGEFLRIKPNANKKQRVQAIKIFYAALLKSV